MILLGLRGVFAALLIGIALFAFTLFEEAHRGKDDALTSGVAAAVTVLAAGTIILVTDLRGRNKQIATLSAVYFGLLLGLLLGWLFSLALGPVVEAGFPDLNAKQTVKLTLLTRLTLSVLCCYVTISTLVQTKDDFRFLIPYVEFSKQVKGGRPLVLDTSVIIDGRIADLCDTRIIDTKLIVPRFVLNELQGIADSADKLKRNRGRRGLDVLKRLQANPRVELQMHDGNGSDGGRPGEKVRVDERLVIFARGIGARVVTNDFNLNKIAQLQGVDVINLNEVANSLKTVALPGEYMTIRVVKAGDQIGQGVGYLDDGTMVVVEHGRNQIGQEVPIVVTSVLQTPAGRMIFGRPEARGSGPGSGSTPAANNVAPPGTATGTGSGTSPKL